MLTEDQVMEWLQTDDGKAVEKKIITSYIQTNPEGKNLLEETFKSDIERIKYEAVNEWENKGKGKSLKDHNQKLLDEIKGFKASSEDSKKLKNLLDISGAQDYNSLEDTLFSLKKGDLDIDSELKELRRQTNEFRSKYRDMQGKFPTLEAERDELKNSLQESDSFIANLLIKDQIKSTLLKNGYDEFQASGLSHRVADLGKFHIEKTNEDRRAINESGLTPEEFVVKHYLNSDEGKAFRPNKANGGGAPGGGGNGGAVGKTWKELSWSEKAKMWSEHPEQAKKLKEGG